VVGGPIQGLQINNIRGTNTCNWPDLESVQGTFDFTTCDSFVNGVAGLEGLVNFAYTASWAAVSGSCGSGSGGLPVADPQNTYDAAYAYATRYKAAPFNLKFIQIANEPTQAAGFFCGTDSQFVNTYFAPAAQAICDAGMYVVAPTWPASNSDSTMSELKNDVLNVAATSSGEWQGKTSVSLTDYIDIHYLGVVEWQTLWASYGPSGSNQVRGLWQSEVGYTSGTGSVSKLYVPALWWALSPTGGDWQDSSDPDKFKLFWYADTCGANCLSDGTTLSENGQEYLALQTIFGNSSLSTFTNFTGVPQGGPDGCTNCSFGFQIGNSGKVMVAVFGSGTASSTIQVSGFASAPSSCAAEGVTGGQVTPTCSYSGGTETVTLSSVPQTGMYVVLTP
jgi:hypothetical protein